MQEAFTAATRLLNEQDDASLRYAALELRRCLEALVYEKLKTYRDVLPEGSVSRWQPPQAFEALIEIEPEAQETYTFAVAPETEPGKLSGAPFQQIGVDERPNAKWIKKTWHSLGSHLHAEWPFATSKKAQESPRPFLEKTLADLEPLANNSFSGTMNNVVEFSCQGCEERVKVLLKAIEAKHHAACLTCGLRYRAEKVDDGWMFYPDEPPFNCDSCGNKTYVASGRVKVGYEFPCRSCGRKFVIVRSDWRYAPLEKLDQEAEPK
ncbi:MAG: hypothetical protein JO033_01555 [Acidobacteriaceae bacterium]|nr:hypothetical protein [Acidobacteriaceae bacterium]